MHKKSTKKSALGVAEATVVGEEKKTSTPSKKSGNEIDEIFAGKKRKKPDSEKAKKPAGDVEASKTYDKLKKKSKKKKDSKKSDADKENGNDFADRPSRARKRTGDGLTIYTEEELGIGRADAGELQFQD